MVQVPRVMRTRTPGKWRDVSTRERRCGRCGQRHCPKPTAHTYVLLAARHRQPLKPTNLLFATLEALTTSEQAAQATNRTPKVSAKVSGEERRREIRSAKKPSRIKRETKKLLTVGASKQENAARQPWHHSGTKHADGVVAVTRGCRWLAVEYARTGERKLLDSRSSF